jgi:hypothetical protein
MQTEAFLSVLSGSLPKAPLSAKALKPFPLEKGIATFQYQPESTENATPYSVQVEGGPSWTMADDPVLLGFFQGTDFNRDLEVKFSSLVPHPRDDLEGGTTPFPESVSLLWKENGAERRLELRHKEIRLGFAIPENFFVLERPEGFTQEAL